jgi:hypothetical protein
MPAAGPSYSGAVEEAEDTCRSFVQMWAEAVMLQVERVRQIRRKANADGRAYERMEDWSPDALDLARTFRAQWTEEQTLVWAAHQVERWARRLAEERGEEPPPRDQVLADLRNALEHLDEAEFDGGHAVPGGRSRSLRHCRTAGSRSRPGTAWPSASSTSTSSNAGRWLWSVPSKTS